MNNFQSDKIKIQTPSNFNIYKTQTNSIISNWKSERNSFLTSATSNIFNYFE